MSLADELEAICKDCKVPESFTNWLVDEELLEPLDVALIAAKEEEVDEKIIASSAIGGLRTKHRVAIKKVWMRCKALKDQEAARRSGTLRMDDEEPLDEPTRADLHLAWYNWHRFNLGTHRLLADGMFGKVF
jgi:hypothetical protein